MKRLPPCLFSVIGRRIVRSLSPLNRFLLMARNADPPGLRRNETETLVLSLSATVFIASIALSPHCFCTRHHQEGQSRVSRFMRDLMPQLPLCWLLTPMLIDRLNNRLVNVYSCHCITSDQMVLLHCHTDLCYSGHEGFKGSFIYLILFNIGLCK